VSTISETSDLPATPRTRRREWLLRGAFEASLILLGLLGAFALNEWQDARTRASRVDTLLAAVRTELETNLARHARASAFNSEMADLLWNEGSKGVDFVPASAYPNGLFRGPSLTSAAWTTAQNDTAFSDVPVERVLMLARVYELQRVYVDDFSTLANNMYATLLAPNNETLRVDGISQPIRLGGVLRDYAGRGEQLVEAYRTTLLKFGVDPATRSLDAAALDGATPAAGAPSPAEPLPSETPE
jgi:hypothetical protein